YSVDVKVIVSYSHGRPMTETERIADQLRRAFYGDAWHGPSVLEALSGVTAGVAAQRPVAGAHTIWELVHHITAWADIVRRRLEGDPFQIAPELDWPPIQETTDAAWNQSVERMKVAESSLRELTLRIPESQLDDSAKEGAPSRYILLHGVVQHSLYHAGQ